MKLPPFTSIWHCCLLRNRTPHSYCLILYMLATEPPELFPPLLIHPSNQRCQILSMKLPTVIDLVTTESHIQVNDQWLTVLHPNINFILHLKFISPICFICHSSLFINILALVCSTVYTCIYITFVLHGSMLCKKNLKNTCLYKFIYNQGTYM